MAGRNVRHDTSPLTPEQVQTFLENLSDGVSVQDSATQAGRKKQMFYRLRERDHDFAAAWAIAWAEGGDKLIREAQRRAVEGVEDVKVIGAGDYQREITFRRYSDVLLMFLIKQRDPTYRENAKLEVTGDGGGPVQVAHEQRLTLAHLLAFAESVPGLSGNAGGELPEPR